MITCTTQGAKHQKTREWVTKKTIITLLFQKHFLYFSHTEKINYKRMSNFNFKRTPLTDEMVIRGERFVKVNENKELGLICYKREWKDTCGGLNHCYEIIKPVGKDKHYPHSEQFGTYGLCLSKNDRHLQEKIDWYIKNGMGERFPSLSRK